MTALIGLRDNLAASRVHVLIDLPKDTDEWVGLVTRALDAGADLVQLSGSRLSRRKNQAALEEVREQTFSRRALLAIGSDLKAARAFGADLVMLDPDEDQLSIEQARPHEFSLVGRQVAAAGAIETAAARSDYLYLDAAPHGLLAAAVSALPPAPAARGAMGGAGPIPWFATGVSTASINQVVDAGAVRVALHWSQLNQADPAKDIDLVADRLRGLWQSRPMLEDDRPPGHRAPWEVGRGTDA